MLPGAAVVDGQAAQAYAAGRPATVTYTGPARVGPPVVPLQVFGVYYDIDVVLVSRHPSWDMHEYARLNTGDGMV